MADSGFHLAVLTIGESGVSPDDTMIVERLRAAGHAVVSRASVDNFVPVVRRQLAAWISDPNIDVAVVVGGGDDGVASSALAPLVTQPLPGFADVFRLLMFQALGSAAVLVHAEAARCQAKVVFLLPALADGVRLALDKLIVPQLDARTEPYNVARLLPRRAGVGKAPPPSSSSQPGGVAPSMNKTMPPPFKRVVTPPVGVEAKAPAPAPVADKPKAVDDAKVIVDIDTLGGVAEDATDDVDAPATNPNVNAVAAAPEPESVLAKTVPITKIAKLSETEKIFVISAAGDSSPRVAMFAKPKRRGAIPWYTKVLAGLALLATVSALAIILYTRLSLRAQTVSANDKAPPATVDATVKMPVVTVEIVDAAMPTVPNPASVTTLGSDVDVEPAHPTPPPTPTPTQAHPIGPRSPVTPHDHVAVTPPVTPVTPGHVDTPPVTPVTPAAPVEDGCDEVSCVLDKYTRACCAPFKPRDPEVTMGPPRTLDKVAVRTAVDTMKPVVQTCGERFHAKGRGVVKIRLEVAPDGHVTSSSVEESPDTGLGACVAEALRRVHFPSSRDGASFSYPYTF